ncbi:MAG TPA: Ppx/GppA phosphatase family protein [Geobacteraceae bacterium]|nr:Ppx/GppA phosphatase family protein [Geobacteraceae bacterium]
MKYPLAAIDLGTNTARLLIGNMDAGGRIIPVVYMRRITRLGGGFTKDKGISAAACERSLAALNDFAEEMRRHGVGRIRAVATSAVRDAVNGEEFVARVLSETGIELKVIDGATEGRLTLRGVLAEIDEKDADFMVFDVGGGSTEYTLARGEQVLFTESLPLGVVRLTEGKNSFAAMEEKVLRELARLREMLVKRDLLPRLESAVLVGTAGTATSLAAISMKMIEYDYRLVNNYVMDIDEIREIMATLLPLKPDERLAVPGLEKGREDLIIAGILIIVKTMETFGFRRLKVSDFGLLEGVLLWARD